MTTYILFCICCFYSFKKRLIKMLNSWVYRVLTHITFNYAVATEESFSEIFSCFSIPFLVHHQSVNFASLSYLNTPDLHNQLVRRAPCINCVLTDRSLCSVHCSPYSLLRYCYLSTRNLYFSSFIDLHSGITCCVVLEKCEV